MLALVLLLVLLPGVASAEGDGNTASTDWVTGTTTYTYTSLDLSAGNFQISADDDVVLDFTGVDTSQDITRTITLTLNSPGLTVSVKGPADNKVGVSLTIKQMNSASSTTEEAGSTVFLKDFRADKLTLETPESTPPLTVKYDGNCYIDSLFVTACTDCSIKNADASAQLEIGTMWSKILSSSATGDDFNSDNKLTLSGALVFNGGISSPNLVIQDANVNFSKKDGVVAKHLAIENSTINGVGQIATISGAFALSNDTGEGVKKFKESKIEITGSTLYFDSDVFEGNVNSTVLGNSETINIKNSKIYNVVSTGSLGCVGGLFKMLTITDSEVHAQSDSAAAIGPHDSAYDYYDNCDITAPSIAIDGSVIEAVSKKGAAIGMPRFSSEPSGAVPTLSIKISGNSDITATSVQSAAIGGAYYGTKSQVDGGIEAEISAGISGGSGFSLLSLWDGLVRLLAGENPVQEGIVSSEQLMNDCTLTIMGSPAINAKSGVLAVYASSVTASGTNLVQNTLVTKESSSYQVYPMETPGEVTIGSAPLGSIGYGYASVATTGVAVQSNQAMKFGDAPLVDATNESATTFSVNSTGFQQFFTTPRLSLSGTVKLVDYSDGAEVTGSAAVGTTLKVDLSELLPSAASKSNSLSYAWYHDGAIIDNASSDTYELTESDSGKVVYCVVSGTGSFTGSVTSNAVTVSDCTTLDAPKLNSRTKNRITLESNATQYGIVRNGQITWQDSSTFSSLSPFTAYTFVQKNSSDSISGAVTIYTLPGENDLVIDYVNETLSFPSGVNLYSDAECSTSAWLNQHSSTTRIKISDYIASAGSEDNTLYACYSKADYAAPITIPARPSASIPVSINATSDTISFIGEAGVNYRLLAGGNVVETKTANSNETISFSNLSPATDYSLRARKEADRSNFASAWSEEKTIKTSAAAPDAPALSVKAAYVGEGYESVQVGLSWTTPAANGSTITGYTLTVTEQGTDNKVYSATISSGKTSSELTASADSELKPGEKYNFVLSVNWSESEDAVLSNTASCALPYLKPDPNTFTIDYVNETITVLEDVRLYTDNTCSNELSPFDGAESTYALTDCVGTTIYARFNGVTDATAVTDYSVPSRPNGPYFSIDSNYTTYDAIEVYVGSANVGSVFNLYLGENVVQTYTRAKGDGNYQKFTNLIPSTTYTIKAQSPAVEEMQFKSIVREEEVTTAALAEKNGGDILVLAGQYSYVSVEYNLDNLLDEGATISSVSYESSGNIISSAVKSANEAIKITAKTMVDNGAIQNLVVIARNADGSYCRLTLTAKAVDVFSRSDDNSVFWVESEVTEDEKVPVSAACANKLEDLGAGAEIVDVVRLTPCNPVGGGLLSGNTSTASYQYTVGDTYSSSDTWAVYRVDDASSTEASMVDSSSASGKIGFTATGAGGYYAIIRKPVVESSLSVELPESPYGEDTFKQGESISAKVTVNAGGTVPEGYPSPTGAVGVYAGSAASDTPLAKGQLDPGGTVTIEVEGEGGASLQVGDHSLYFEYEGDTNYQVSSCLSTLKIIAPPGKPTLNATPETNAVSLNWGKPVENGSQITGYTLTVSANGLTVESISIEAEKTSYTVSNLEAGKTYTFALTATNAAGSTSSDEVSAAPLMPNYYAVVISSGITGGTVAASPQSAAEGETVTVTATPESGYEVASVSYAAEGGPSTDITSGEGGKYTFEMPAAPVTVSATFDAIPPAAPTGLAATAGKRSVKLTWETPSGGVAVDYYELVVTRDGSSSGDSPTRIEGGSTSHTVGGLEAGATYTFTLTAVTAAGGEASANAKATVPAEYKVSVDNNIANGMVTVNPESAIAGETVTVTATPNEGYKLESVTYSHDDETQEIVPNDGVYTFEMPAAPVTVSAVFVAIQGGGDVTIDPAPGGGGGSVVESPDPVTYGVTVTCGEGGTATSNVDSAAEGDVVAVTMTPNAGYEVASVTVSYGDTVEDVSGEKGVYSFEMPSEAVVVSVTFRSTGEGDYSDLPFTDVTENDWFIEPVAYVYRHGIMTGYAGTSLFGPTDSLGREQAAQVLYNALGNGAKAPACPLVDVDQSAWYADAVNWAYDEGLLTGYGDGSHEFGIDEPLTREQFAAIIARVAGANLDDVDTSVLERFSDTSDVADWSRPALSWAVQNSVLGGSQAEDGTLILRASADINRAEMAQMIMNAANAGLLSVG